MEERCKVVCLTPVFNEEWIIEKFLLAASVWADIIIISDQGSTDKTVEIASKFPKVRLIDNSILREYDENAYRLPLYNEVKKIEGKKLIFQLDADEFLTPNFDDLEWKTMKESPVGTRFIFNWYNIQPNFISYFMDEKPLAYIYDGRDYNCGILHQLRIPVSSEDSFVKLNSIGVLHYQFLNWERMELKQMWYRMYEKVIFPKKHFITIWRMYHFDKNLPIDTSKIYPISKDWINGYNRFGIEITSYKKINERQWDERMINYILKYGWKRFKRIDVKTYHILRSDKENRLQNIKLKYNIMDRILIRYLSATQKYKEKNRIKVTDYILMKIFK